MGYLHIDNLYKNQGILAFKKCYALEKIHGTSAHIRYDKGVLTFFSGGESHANFAALFDAEALAAKFAEKFNDTETVVIYGEAYGGKQQHMSATYGKALKFVAFDVDIDGQWLSVPKAEEFCLQMGIEFVDFALVSTDIEAIDAERDKPSTQAKRNGIEGDQLREGVVLRPPFEVLLNNGKRIITKHKRAEFSERGSPKLENLDPTKRVILEQAESIAQEWVTPMRLEHVLNQIVSARDDKDVDMKDIPLVMSTMYEDIVREAAGEVYSLAPARKAISTRAVKLFKERLFAGLREAAKSSLSTKENHAV